jgi:hypothetical protein
VPLEIVEILRNVSPGEDAAVDGRMEGDDTVAKELREARQLLDRRDRDPLVVQEAGGAAAGDQVDVKVLETLRELDQAGLVVCTQERALDQEKNTFPSRNIVMAYG